jgi:8-oxo-dGTP pyrophosphatase MutT (NUDIX family)
MTDAPVLRVERMELVFAPQPWAFASERRMEIDAHFAALCRERPLWNGRVLLLHRHRLEDGLFSGAFLETDYASFVAWRNWGCPEAGVVNCFAMAALRGSDGAFLLGEMAPHTAVAGRVYFPAGTPEPDDVVQGTVDLAANVARELAEETGLTFDDVTPEPGWHTVPCGPRIAHMKVLQAREPAAALRERILSNLARERQPELADIVIVRSTADFDPRMPPFVTIFLSHLWSR